ncbi:hypothetical protein M408DRAFT_291639 [Serendipita vermifera MAFF 305830]|uniref:C2H2-type domain-containing protein n=1 Tax=Serendipita vermifera MAFF 305830 TaxID=933852 RepID=A0A0C3ACA2_SERVB|nr:hypothetical protein M408DRAFT_291639 [Serendipita vermifera MAFF 305830]
MRPFYPPCFALAHALRPRPGDEGSTSSWDYIGEEYRCCEECIRAYYDFVRTYPEMSIDLMDLPPSTADAAKDSTIVENDQPSLRTGRQLTPTVGPSSSIIPSTNGTNATTNCPETTTAPTSSTRMRYYCVECGHPFNRLQRARDCAYKDLGLTPHICGGRCGSTVTCSKAYSSEERLHEHLAPAEERIMQCLQWYVIGLLRLFPMLNFPVGEAS